METLIVVLALLAILGGAVCYIIHAKKKGQKCIGCPNGGSCSSSCTDCAGCCGKCQSKQ